MAQDGDGSETASNLELTRPQRLAAAEIDNIIANNAKEHDFSGVIRELRGESTGYDHVTEMRQSIVGLRVALASLQGSLANPHLAPWVRHQLEAASERAQVVMRRMLDALSVRR